ncbi:hypothetical protein [Rhodococcus sp. IEGM 1318]|uniref:hypothetical protein n=1 Tax=Rhodococcus sp. IEGM 1318 TaxID=3082226 RepID=UPI0029558577|nr:hypothetical protein [Rhodococcus sp. IEGM 1318]MDV8005548.1 hypothetical protein [Rhodococcus sp. IEGM 1318]
MKIRTLATAGTLTAGIALIGVLGAGAASAATPLVEPEFGRIGLSLSNAETAALAASPIPDAISDIVPGSQRWIDLAPGSALTVAPDGKLSAPDRVVIGEAAAHPGGYVDVYLADPNHPVNAGFIVQTYQHWN